MTLEIPLQVSFFFLSGQQWTTERCLPGLVTNIRLHLHHFLLPPRRPPPPPPPPQIRPMPFQALLKKRTFAGSVGNQPPTCLSFTPGISLATFSKLMPSKCSGSIKYVHQEWYLHRTSICLMKQFITMDKDEKGNEM